MQNAETVLNVIRERGERGLPLENIYRLLYNNNIITNRHNLAHKSGSSITFREVEAFYEEGHIVLDFFRGALFTKMLTNPSMQG